MIRREDSGTPRVELSEYLIYVRRRGSQVNPMDYVAGISIHSTLWELGEAGNPYGAEDIEVTNPVDTSVPGVYEIGLQDPDRRDLSADDPADRGSGMREEGRMRSDGRYTYRSEQNPQTLRVDWDCLFRDLLRQWWLVLLTGLTAAPADGSSGDAAALHAAVYGENYVRHQPDRVQLRSDFRKSFAGGNHQRAGSAQVVNSSILRGQVSEDLGISGFPASVSVDTVESSNLMELTVTARVAGTGLPGSAAL